MDNKKKKQLKGGKGSWPQAAGRCSEFPQAVPLGGNQLRGGKARARLGGPGRWGMAHWASSAAAPRPPLPLSAGASEVPTSGCSRSGPRMRLRDPLLGCEGAAGLGPRRAAALGDRDAEVFLPGKWLLG